MVRPRSGLESVPNCLRGECVTRTESAAEEDGIERGPLPFTPITRMTSDYVSKSEPGAFEQGLRHLQSLSGENWSRLLLVKAKRKRPVEVDLPDMYVEERTLLKEIDTPVPMIFREQVLVSLVPKRYASVCDPKL